MDPYIDRLKIINREYSYQELVRLANSLRLKIIDPTEENYRTAILEWMDKNNHGKDLFEDMPVEILLEIAKFLPDEDILNLCQTNLNFYILCDDVSFWKNRALTKGYISKLDEFGAKEFWPFNSYRKKTPQERYLQLLSLSGKDCVPGSEKYKLFWKSECPRIAGRKGNIELINYFINEGGYIDDALLGAVEGRYIELSKYIISQNADNFYGTVMDAVNAVKEGNLDVAEYLLINRFNDLNVALVDASENGNIEIVKYLIKKGATYVNWALAKAAYGGHIEIVKYLIENKRITDLNYAISEATRAGHTEIVEYLMSQENI